jgi:hypothetical protein
MTDKIDLQKQLEIFKYQMKEVNESLYKFESEFEKEKAKIEKLRYSFAMTVKLINHELIESMNNINFILSKLNK